MNGFRQDDVGQRLSASPVWKQEAQKMHGASGPRTKQAGGTTAALKGHH